MCLFCDIQAKTPLTIGGKLWGENNFWTFDEVAIWNRAMLEEEIETLYNNSIV